MLPRRTPARVFLQGRSDERSIKIQVEHYHTTLVHTRQVEVATSQILDVEGIATISYPFYYNFARSLDKPCRCEISGQTRDLEAGLLLNLWVGRGLTQSVLETIRTMVFNIGPPTP